MANGKGGNLGVTNVTLNGIRADAFYLAVTWMQGTNSTLFVRNETNDMGLGVCTDNEGGCADPGQVNGVFGGGGGDNNGLDNLGTRELIRLTRPDNTVWTSLIVSSLDNSNGSTTNVEDGTLFWSNTADPNSGLTNSATFKFGDFNGAVEGDILTLAALSGFDASAQYVFFIAGNATQTSGTDNDYLVRTATVVPIPAAFWLFGSAMVGMVGLGRRKSAQAAS